MPFGLDWMRANVPHYLKVAPSAFHVDLYADLRDFHRTRGSRRNYRAPRGSAKSSIGTKGYALYCAVEGIEPFTLILSDAGPQAKEFLEDIRGELEENPRLAANYPDAVGKGPVWRADDIVLRNGCRIKTKGSSGKIRGAGKRADRPSLVIGDDLNGDDDAFSKTLRERKLNWFKKAIQNIGDPYTNMLDFGTPIHRDAVVCQLTDGEISAGWETRSYRAIIRWPDRMDLWDTWMQLRLNLGDADRAVTSDAYFAANREAMLAGSQVLWPEWEPLEALMKKRAEIGEAAFNCEKQDKVGTVGSTEWPTEYFDDPKLWFFEWPELSHKVLILDPSKGAGDKVGDYQAHVFGGVGLHDGLIYLDAHLVREDAGAMVGHALDLCRDFRPDVWSFEDNGTLGLLQTEAERQLAERAAAGHPLLCPLEAYTSMDAKASRIRYLGVYLSAGMLRIRNTPGGRLLVQQTREWPNSDHDDGPDAAGSAVRRLERLVNEGV
jgi:hypothetical protein